jgi:hypothetical protein
LCPLTDNNIKTFELLLEGVMLRDKPVISAELPLAILALKVSVLVVEQLAKPYLHQH